MEQDNQPALTIFGMGYVGLPLAREAVKAGMTVTGVDVSEKRVATIREGKSPVGDLTDEDITEMLNNGFRVDTIPHYPGRHPDVIVICVPTPLSDADGPDLTFVRAATRSAGAMLRSGALVVLESTTYPGTTDEVIKPLLEEESGLRAGRDFALAFSPERIDPGNPVYGLVNTAKVVGGYTPACTERAAAFYSLICKDVVTAKSAREAEMTKLLENTYRQVNIALLNEMAIFSHDMGIDIWDVVRCAATKPFGFESFRPGPGVGGHCIAIDAKYLASKVLATTGYPFRFVELAQEVNNKMPAYVVTRAAELLNKHSKPLWGSLIMLYGVTYKPNVADQRESVAPEIARRLMAAGAKVLYDDPYASEWFVDGIKIQNREDQARAFLSRSPRDPDLAILLQAHSTYNLDGIASTSALLLDTTGRAPRFPQVEAL